MIMVLIFHLSMLQILRKNNKVFDSVHERIRKSAGDSWCSKIFLKKLESNKTKSEFAYKLLEVLGEESYKTISAGMLYK